MITENLSTLKIHKLSQEQYDRELANGNIDANALYLTPDETVDLSGYATVEQLNDKLSKSSGGEVVGDITLNTIVLTNGVNYGTIEQMNAIDPFEGQLFFVISE